MGHPKGRQKKRRPETPSHALDEFARHYDPRRYFTISLDDDDPLTGQLPVVWVAALGSAYRAHLRRMTGLAPEDAIAELDRAMQADRDDEDLEGDGEDIRIMLTYDVRYRPDY